MAELTFQELLDAGISLEDLLLKQPPSSVEVSVDTEDLVKAFQDAQNINTEVFTAIERTLKSNSIQNKDLLVKALSFILKDNQKRNIPQAPIIGLEVTARDHEGRIDKIMFIRETIN